MIFTIGYEGSSLEKFLETLKSVNIDLLVDLRDITVSRKKGFSKNQLRLALENVGIDYSHLRGLGDPKDGRIAAREGRLSDFVAIYNRHLKSEVAVSDFNKLLSEVDFKRVALLCYEINATSCHRKIVADKLANFLGLKVAHLKSGSDYKGLDIGKRASNYFSQSMAAAE